MNKSERKSEGYWGWKGSFCLLKDLNCALASQEVLQDMTGKREDRVLQAVTGLEGGVVACGSTCGVVTGGALGLALMYDNVLKEKGVAAEMAVMSSIEEYIKWFEDNYGSSLCRERSGVNFYKTGGQLRYLLPGDRVGKCLWHIRGAMKHLYGYQKKDLPDLNVEQSGTGDGPVHCAQAVLKGIRNRTGVGDPLLERLSFIFDGGLAFKGGACGALVGAIAGINLLLGMNVRDSNYFKTIKAFVIGHVNLLVDKPFGAPEPFCIGRNIVQNFVEKARTIECRSITEKKFSGWADFQKHMSSSDKCAGLIELATAEASNAIKSFI
jgi:C_GCAxxG_C_C family probable redox protein